MMARTAGIALVLLASATIALGSPLCCLVGNRCCGTATAPYRDALTRGCARCHRNAPGKQAPAPCEHADGCKCKSDVTSRVTANPEHAPLVAVVDAPAAALPALVAAPVSVAAHRTLPPSPSRRSHPLLL